MLLSTIKIGLNFSSKRIFVSEYFGAECCCKFSEPDWSRSQLKKYRSEAGEATPLHSCVRK